MPFTIAALDRFQGFCVEIFTCVRYQTCCQQDEEIGANINKMGRYNVLSEIPKLSDYICQFCCLAILLLYFWGKSQYKWYKVERGLQHKQGSLELLCHLSVVDFCRNTTLPHLLWQEPFLCINLKCSWFGNKRNTILSFGQNKFLQINHQFFIFLSQ